MVERRASVRKSLESIKRSKTPVLGATDDGGLLLRTPDVIQGLVSQIRWLGPRILWINGCQ